jgi:hypothetical protein
VVDEFSARRVAIQVIEHLERRRAGIVDSDEAVRAEIKAALVPVRRAYGELELPGSYVQALEEELGAVLPARWRAAAGRFTRLEREGFGIWRGGDVVARVGYVVFALVLGAILLRAPFIPLAGKWIPFVLAVLAWWLPDVQARWHRRRYARELNELVASIASAQPALDRHIELAELLPPRN